MADILNFHPAEETICRRFVRETRSERPTQEIIEDLKPLRMIGEQDAVARGVLFAELAVKTERGAV